ncbi:uncharacterized protein LOC105703201 [Orussus abietinus]|uniref:uncharacterized protein LOC105703201 n=1 Tax=Orussus abietinus TaxID=222816 RepID=UPI0006260399|nr:uncharacterized protein LOC105703201 [Orussus abietinus]
MTKPCIVPKCKTGYISSKKKCSVFKVPSYEPLRKQWEIAIPGILFLKSTQFVCEKHFEDKCIIRKYIKHDANGRVIAESPYQRPRLADGAVPSIFSNYPPDTDTSEAPVKGMESKSESSVPEVKNIVQDMNACGAKQPISETIYVKPVSLMVQSEDKESSVLEDAGNTPIKQTFSINESTSLSLNAVSTVGFHHKGNPSSVALPKSWSIVEHSVGNEKWFIFSHVIISTVNNEDIHVLKKSVTVDGSGRMRYYVYGREVNIEQTHLPRVLSNAKLLPVTLYTFEKTRICEGLGNLNISFSIDNLAFRDHIDNWHHTQCRLLAKRTKCDMCKRLKKTLLQKEARLEKRKQFSRISRASNPEDQKKLNDMRKTLNLVRRTKNRAILRIRMLTNVLKERQDEIAAIKDQSLEEKCLLLNISEVQKTAMKEIIAAAKKDPKGRHYSQDWIKQCSLMYTQSPTYYNFLRENNVIPLPCSRTIRLYAVYQSKMQSQQ